MTHINLAKVPSYSNLFIVSFVESLSIGSKIQKSSPLTLITGVSFRKSPNAIHFVDPADIDSRRDGFKNDLLKLASFVDILSLNENEGRSLRKASGFSSLLPTSSYDGNDLKTAAKKLSSKFRMS